MSFQDVSKRRMHPIFDSHRRSGDLITRDTTPSNNYSTRRHHNQTKSSRQQSSSGNSRSSPLFGFGGTSKTEETSSSQRGVRPRLSMSCPVTSKNLLMEDLASQGSRSVATQDTVDTSSSQEESENPAVLPLRSSRSSNSPKSIFAHLSTSITNFQKMVAQLETLLQDAGSSPEVQWRSRILVQSSKDADRDIQERLQQVSESSSPSSRTQVALRKLHRDFGRVRTQLRQILQSYERKQQVEVSFLNKQDETREEFFDRAMRERDAEVQRIHKSMHQVNSIYQDLAGMVDGQQDQIDKIAEGTKDSKENTRAGLGSVQNGIFALCGPITVDEDVIDGKGIKEEEGYRVNEEFDWTMPFETLGDDWRAVQIDVLRFGRDLMEDIHYNVQGKFLESPCNQGPFECHEHTEDLEDSPKQGRS